MAWSKTSKDWDYARPFHRINSPSYLPGQAQVDGRGYLRGCRRPADGPDDSVYGLIIRDLMRTIPGWVPVAGEQEQEVEGTLNRSFQTWTDVPLYQFHRYYDWNFHLEPAEGFTYVRGLGNEPHGPSMLGRTQRRVTSTASMECEWDCGAFGRRPGAMFNNPQWIWPMTGQYLWVSGRWIYDCGHAEHDLMRSELHPCKAIASAQWEAVSFPENNNLYVPGIRFQFFASQLGGYKLFNAINDRDYEFIVDLPRLPGERMTWNIGHTPEFPLNTAVLRTPHLLHHADFISTASGQGGSVQPIIEPIPPESPDQLPQQVKVKIPLTQLGMRDNYYGVILKLGWFDPDRSQARRVKKCTVNFKHVLKGHIDHDDFAEEWLVKFGANGRWFLRNFTDVHNGQRLNLNQRVEFFLSEDDSIYVTSHGAELDLVDDVFQERDGDRTVRLNGADVDWERDIVHGSRQRTWDICYEIANMMWTTFNDQNEPLGLIDPDPSVATNPWKVDGPPTQSNQRSLRAFSTTEVGDSAELVTDTSVLDYTLVYEVSIEPQRV